MAIGSLNLTPEEKFIEKLEASLEKKSEGTAPVSPPLLPKLSAQFHRKSIKRTNVRTDKRTGGRMTVRTNDQKTNRSSVQKAIRSNGR